MLRDVQKKGVEMAQRQEGTRPLSRCASRAGRLGLLTGGTVAASPWNCAGAAGTVRILQWARRPDFTSSTPCRWMLLLRRRFLPFSLRPGGRNPRPG